MRNRFDHLSKNIGKAALAPSGDTAVHDEIAPEIQHADLRHEPDPARAAERRRLGLLGRLAAVPCLLEIYGHAPSPEELRACLAKHLAFWRRREREARARRRRRRAPRARAAAAPFLWIIAAGRPTAMLRELPAARAATWPTGVYCFGGDVLRVGIVVASELPRIRDTLLVRLMAAGPLLAPAVEDLARLSPRAHERAVAERILLDLQHVLALRPSHTPEELELIMTIRRSWEDARAEGRAEGRVETQANAVLAVLRTRGIAVPAAARKQILAETDLRRLERWLERAIVAASVDEVLAARAARRPAAAAAPAHGPRHGKRPARAAAQR